MKWNCLLFVFVASFVSITRAQDNRGQVIEGIFRSIFESQMDQRNRTQFPQANVGPRGGSRPDITAPASPRGSRPSSVAPDVIAFRRQFDAFDNQLGVLTRDLNSDVRRIDGLRPLMAEVWQVKARADAMKNTYASVPNTRSLTEPYCEIDSQWRHLSYELRSVDQLSRACRSSIETLDQQSNDLCKLLGIEPQFDRGRLMQLMLIASTHMEDLLDDLQFDHAGYPNADRLLHDGRILQQQLRGEAEHARYHSYDKIIAQFTAFVQQWREFSGKLYQLDDPRIDRRLARIRHVGAQVFDLLRIDAPQDRVYLQYAADQYHRNLESLMDTISARMLVGMPADQQSSILRLAAKLTDSSGRICGSISARKSRNLLRDEFRGIDADWRQLSQGLSSVQSQPFATAYQSVGRCHDELCEVIGYQPGFEMHHALETTSALEALALRLYRDIHRVDSMFSDRRYRADVVSAVDAFYERSQDLYVQVSHRSASREIRQTTIGLINEWNTMAQLIAVMPQEGLPQSHFAPIAETYHELAPIVANLAATFGQ